MRIIRLTGLGVVAVMVTLALVSAGSASAKQIGLVLCKKLELLCKQSNVIGPPGKLLPKDITAIDLLALLQALALKLNGALGETCKEAHITLTVLGEPKANTTAIGNVTGMTFGGCEPCETVKAAALPYEVKITGTEEGTGTVTGPMALKLTCMGGMATCEFSAKEVELDLIGSASEPAVEAVEESLTLAVGTKALCGSSVKLTASYLFIDLVEDLLYLGTVLQAHLLPLELFPAVLYEA